MTTPNETATETFNIETSLAWGPGKDVKTSQGRRILRVAPVTDEFRKAWKADKAALKAAGLSWGPGKAGDFAEVCWWQPVSQEQAQKENAAIEASRATDANVDVPCPEGLEMMAFQKAGVNFILKAFSGLQ
jgi:hypothetical protein